jgi:hypothetical protein
VARVDRRVSPNQIALRTVDELRSWTVSSRRVVHHRAAQTYGWIKMVVRMIGTVLGLVRPAPCPRRALSVGNRRATAISGGSSAIGPRSQKKSTDLEEGQRMQDGQGRGRTVDLPLFRSPDRRFARYRIARRTRSEDVSGPPVTL